MGWYRGYGLWGPQGSSSVSSLGSPSLEQVGGYLQTPLFDQLTMSSMIGACIKCYQCSSTEDRRGTPDGVWSKDPYSQDRLVSVNRLHCHSSSHEDSVFWLLSSWPPCSWCICSGSKIAAECTTLSKRRETFLSSATVMKATLQVWEKTSFKLKRLLNYQIYSLGTFCVKIVKQGPRGFICE